MRVTIDNVVEVLTYLPHAIRNGMEEESHNLSSEEKKILRGIRDRYERQKSLVCSRSRSVRKRASIDEIIMSEDDISILKKCVSGQTNGMHWCAIIESMQKINGESIRKLATEAVLKTVEL